LSTAANEHVRIPRPEMIKNIISLAISTICLFVSVGSCYSDEGRFKILLKEKDVTIYYDTLTLSVNNNGDVDVWLKEIYGEQGIQAALERFKKNTTSNEYYKIKDKLRDYKYSKNHEIYNYKSRKFKQLTALYYDASNDLIYVPYSLSSEEAEWSPLVPETMAETIAEKLHNAVGKKKSVKNK
jgi:hypothetical protein